MTTGSIPPCKRRHRRPGLLFGHDGRAPILLGSPLAGTAAMLAARCAAGSSIHSLDLRLSEDGHPDSASRSAARIAAIPDLPRTRLLNEHDGYSRWRRGPGPASGDHTLG